MSDTLAPAFGHACVMSRFVALLLFFSVLGHAHVARATPEVAMEAEVQASNKAQAERYFQAGLSLQKAEDFGAAAAAYETSVTLFPTKSALFNLANCQRAQHRYADAWSTLHRLQTEFGPDLVEPMSSAAQAQLAELDNLTALLTVQTRPEGAAVSVDGAAMGTTPWALPVRLTIGEHSVQAQLDGYAPQINTINLRPRDSASLVLELAPALPVTPPSPAPPPPASDKSPVVTAPAEPRPSPQPSAEANGSTSAWKSLGWVGVAVGGAALAIGASSGLRALDVDERLSRVCESGHCAISEAATIDRLERLTTAASLWTGVGGLLVTGGLTLALWPSSTTVEDVTLRLTPESAAIGGRF